MQILDQRILITKPASLVWQHVSDISKNPSWQTDCRSVSFLTTRQEGVGMRWRETTQDGHERVAEITAWYEGLGYEYTYVDGTPYQQNKGRIRLQEIAEGTIVQWTFIYEVKGLLAGVRNAVRIRRHLESALVDSLRQLWRALNQMAPTEGGVREPKSLMRDAPDYEERSRYRPKHPSAAAARLNPGAEPIVPEPPVSDDDTRPSVARPVADEPPFLTAWAAPKAPEPDAEKARPEAEPQTAQVPPPPPEPVRVAPETETLDLPVFRRPLDTAEAAALKVVTETAQPAETVPTPPEPGKAGAVPEDSALAAAQGKRDTQISVTPTQSHVPTVAEPDPSTKLDTAQISVFEVFGLPKPSETQELRAVTILPEEVEKVAVVVPPAMMIAGRTGLRIVLRRKAVKLRRPMVARRD